MSDERVIRINKVLREFNISLDRAVEFLKDKGIAIDSNPNAKISENEYSILQKQFAGDKGNKEASKEVREEKNKEKEALRLERERELEEKRRQDEERARAQEVIKARAVVTGPKTVGTIDLNPAKPAAPEAEAAAAATTAAEPAEPKATPVAEKPAEAPAPEAAPAAEKGPEEFQTQYRKLSGATPTGQVIDLSQFEKPKKKKEDPRAGAKPGTPGAGAAGDAAKGKRKREPKDGVE